VLVRKRSIVQMVAFGVVVGVAVALVATLIPWLPDAASDEAGPVDSLYWMVTVICIVVFALVAALSVFTVWKFRAGPDDTEDGKPVHGHTKLEIVWTAIPTILVTAISIYSAVVLVQIEDAPAGTRVVNVMSQQFAWSFEYPDQQVTSGELVLPVDRPVELKLRARDVIHSFWVPEWRMKQDAVPGIETRLVITPNKVGQYDVICTELCGLGHGLMRARARVVSQQEFDAWLAEQGGGGGGGGGGGAPDGGALFNSLGCADCHTLADAGATGEVGPNLDETLQGTDEAFIRESIVDPNAQIAEGYQPNVMPNFGEQLSDAQIDALVKYLRQATQGG
jgi:cytochrome c oxidase subunit 2